MANKDSLPSVTQSFVFAKGSLPKLHPFKFKLEESLWFSSKLHVRLEAADPSVDEAKLVGEECSLTVMRGGPGVLVRHINGVFSRATLRAVPLDPITPDSSLPTGIVSVGIT